MFSLIALSFFLNERNHAKHFFLFTFYSYLKQTRLREPTLPKNEKNVSLLQEFLKLMMIWTHDVIHKLVLSNGGSNSFSNSSEKELIAEQKRCSRVWGHQKYVTNNFHRNKFVLSMKACISFEMLFYRQCGIHRIVSKLKKAIATAISIFIGSLNGTFELHYRNENGLWAMKKNDNWFAHSSCVK